MITSEGAEHRSQRQTAQPAFHRQRIGEYARTIVEEAERTRNSWESAETKTRDVAADMMHLTLKVVARTLFATDLRDEVYELAAAINRIMGLYNFLVMLPAAEVAGASATTGAGRICEGATAHRCRGLPHDRCAPAQRAGSRQLARSDAGRLAGK